MAPVGVHDGGNRIGGQKKKKRQDKLIVYPKKKCCSICNSSSKKAGLKKKVIKDDDSDVDITALGDEAEPGSSRRGRRLKRMAIKDDDDDDDDMLWLELDTEKEIDDYYGRGGDYYKVGYIYRMLLDQEEDDEFACEADYEFMRKIMNPYHLRKITEAELQAYNQQLRETGGFDMVDVPGNISNIHLIYPRPNFEKDPQLLEEVKRCSIKAIDFYNRKHRLKGKYQFVKVLKLCCSRPSGYYYYITFEAKAEAEDPLCFQAEVFVPIGAEIAEIDVVSCRLKPKS